MKLRIVRFVLLSLTALALLTSILTTKVPTVPANLTYGIVSNTSLMTTGYFFRVWPRIVIRLARGWNSSFHSNTENLYKTPR